MERQSLHIQYKHICESCAYQTSNKKDFKKHLSTIKHQISVMDSKKPPSEHIKLFGCEYCGKLYNSNSGLWKHNIKCTSKQPREDNADLNDKDLILMLIKQNAKLMNIVETGTTTTNITNSHNKTFNMNFFLNETCKNAMNINDFVSSVTPTIEELEETGKIGYVAGITNVILNRLKNLELGEQPMHCSDAKRETLYVKDKDVWEKETGEKVLITGAIKMIAHKNIKNIIEWQTLYPGCSDARSRKNNEYLNIISNSMSGGDINECNKNINKIISNIAKETMIDR